MDVDEIVRQLHDKATRGLPLTAEEQAQLQAWYAQQDQEEQAILGSADVSQRLATLHTHIETTLAQLMTETQRIQELTVSNEALRREIAVLQRQLPLVSTHKSV